MSDLQLSLLAIGALVVGVVYLHNWLQERKFRRRLRQAFGNAPDDVLLRSGLETVLADGRLEPQLEPAESPGDDADRHAAPARAGTTQAAARDRVTAPGFDAVLDYVAEIDSAAPIAGSAVSELLSKIAACGKPCRAAGFDPEQGEWEDVARDASRRYTRLRLALQLVNRAGAVNPAQFAAFGDAVRGCASRIAATATCPDARAALRSAHELDAFCADVDVAVGINIIAGDGETFAGARIRTLAETAGFRLESDGVFHCRDEQRRTLFTLDNHEPAPFLPEQIQSLSTHGITLLLDVPRVADGVRVFERMLEIARGLAPALGGRLVDDNRVALNEAGIAKIKEQLRSIHAAMEARGIPAGSPRAMRLFS